MDITKEVMSAEFTKCHVHGLPFPAVFHHFTGAADEYAHDHPFNFTTFILKGWYIEEVYHIGSHKTVRHRYAGTSHTVSASTIHRIIELPAGECWTLILPEAWQKEPNFYKFENNIAYVRQWNETEWRRLA